MDSIVQSDIFFFITAVAVIVVTVFVLAALWYVIRILKNIKDISDTMKTQTIFLFSGILGVKKKLAELFDVMLARMSGKKKSTRKKKTSES